MIGQKRAMYTLHCHVSVFQEVCPSCTLGWGGFVLTFS